MKGWEADTCPRESTKGREPHWHPRLTKGEAAFRSFVRLSAEEPVASRVIARKFILAIVLVLLFLLWLWSGVSGVATGIGFILTVWGLPKRVTSSYLVS